MNNTYIIIVAVLGIVIGGYFALSALDTESQRQVIKSPDNANYPARAYFSGGCFWCTESDFEKLPGVGDVVSGYSGGVSPMPTYTNHADHREAVMVPYDPDVISYAELVSDFFRRHDPTDPTGSFYDRGHSYTSAIYYQQQSQLDTATEIIQQIEDMQWYDKPIVTAVEPFIDFTPAENYHQNYYIISPVRYKLYRAASGRDDLIQQVQQREQQYKQNNSPVEVAAPQTQTLDTAEPKWTSYTKPSVDVLQQQLSELEFYVTQEEGTERPFSPGNLDDETREGIFVDILSGEPLFSSRDKFDSTTGWPSFTKPIDEQFVTITTDYRLLYPRREVRSTYADNHLGHVFNDGPAPTGERWCMNGAALRFVALQDMDAQGYGDYLYLFR